MHADAAMLPGFVFFLNLFWHVVSVWSREPAQRQVHPLKKKAKCTNLANHHAIYDMLTLSEGMKQILQKNVPFTLLNYYKKLIFNHKLQN